MSIASKELGINHRGISKACIGDRCQSYMGYVWEYADRDYKKPERKRIGRPIESMEKKVYLYDLELNLIAEYKSATEAALKNKVSRNGISKCCRGGLKTYHGRRWSYEALR